MALHCRPSGIVVSDADCGGRRAWDRIPGGEGKGENRGRRREKERKRVGREREEPALDGEKGLVRDWSGKAMHAKGVENGI
ncbi:hypothetical protein TNCV_505201 [Trichonephila clavipes]|nr:hypothetical protein TNCV_505201 [Trichonephila clavipes]